MKKTLFIYVILFAAFFSCKKSTPQKVNDTASGDIVTVAGNGTSGFSGDGGIATSAKIDSPVAVVTDAIGNVYFIDFKNYRIRKIDESGNISTVAGNGKNMFSGDGGLATLASFTYPVYFTMDHLGNMFVIDNYYIREVYASGAITTVLGNDGEGYSGDGGLARNARINSPFGITVDDSNNIYIADSHNCVIRKINAITEIITTVAGNGTFGHNGDGGLATAAQLDLPNGVAVDKYGNIYITEAANNDIRKVDTNGIISTIVGTGKVGYSGDGGLAKNAEINYPMGIAVDTIGNVYFSDYRNQRIRKISTNGYISTIAGIGGVGGYSGDNGPALSAKINYVSSLACDAEGNVFLADYGNNRIRKINR
jgi:sugar lactone lactonase YvrE